MLDWHTGGKLRSGILFENMKTTRGRFKSALKYCISHELEIRRIKLIESFKSKNKIKFWKNVRHLQVKVNSSVVDGLGNNRATADQI